MGFPPGVRRIVRLPRSREQSARDLEEEIRFHLDMRARAYQRTGAPADDAERRALERFGDADNLRNYCQVLEENTMQRVRWRGFRESVTQDARFALRQFRKNPAFALIAALTLALGIGACTAIFSVVNGVLLEPLPFPHAERMVQLWGTDSGGKRLHFGDPTFDYLAANTRTLSALAEFAPDQMSISRPGDDATRINVAAVSRQFFDVLDVRPLAGRAFAPQEATVGAPMVAVISHALWMREFGGSPQAIGATLRNGTQPVTVIGVLPPGVEFPAGTDLWYPREIYPEVPSYTAHNWSVIARVRAGVSVAQAGGEVNLLLQRLRAAVGGATWTFGGIATGLREEIVGHSRTLLLLVLGASAVLLLIACANVANLLIARLAAREDEIAVRLAIGAGRGRLAQQLLIETSLLATAGGAGGVLCASAGLHALLTLHPGAVPRLGELHVDMRVLAFALVVSAGMALGLGLLAAWRSASGDLHATLAQSQRSQGRGSVSHRLRGLLVVAQLAMTIVLLIGAGLLAHSFARLMAIDPGFRTRGVVVADLALEAKRDSSGIARRAEYYDAIAQQARAIPGVTSVAVSNAEPFSNGSSNGTFLVLPETATRMTSDQLAGMMHEFSALAQDKSRSGWATYRQVGPGYFHTLDIPILSGRDFTDADRQGAPEVAVINHALARTQWGDQNPIGKVIEFGNIDGDATPLTIVGVVGDTREEDLTREPEPAVYVDFHQRPGSGDLSVLLTGAPERAIAGAARAAFRRVEGNVPMRFQNIETIVGASMDNQRFLLLVLGAFGAVALLLATLGIYSVISYLVTQRTREIGVRVALGASRASVVRLVVREGALLAGVGVIAGVACAFALTRTLQHLLYGIRATDVTAFAAVSLLVILVATVASYLPARRAARVEPMTALREG